MKSLTKQQSSNLLKNCNPIAVYSHPIKDGDELYFYEVCAYALMDERLILTASSGDNKEYILLETAEEGLRVFDYFNQN